jgi:1-phosphatidylinositol phosphodiesterase
VLDDCKNFLTAHPSEFIIMRVREEYSKANDVTKSFGETFNDYYNEYKDFIHLTDYIPTVKEVRGKI